MKATNIFSWQNDCNIKHRLIDLLYKFNIANFKTLRQNAKNRSLSTKYDRRTTLCRRCQCGKHIVHFLAERNCTAAYIGRGLREIGIQTNKRCLGIGPCHTFKRQSDDRRSIKSNSKLQQYEPGISISFYKRAITFHHVVPPPVFDKVPVNPDMDVHPTTTDRTAWYKT